jgi:hypothetical protein
MAVVCALMMRHFKGPSPEALLTSCANHTVQLRFLIMTYAERHERFPEAADAREAVVRMNDAGGWPPDWAHSYSSACPESFLRDKSIGYVYVGSGLPTKPTTEQPALVFFCPASSHQRPEHQCFAVMVDGMRYLKSNAEMIALLRSELGRDSSSAVGYSAGARARMRRELATREEYEKTPQSRAANRASRGG